MTNLADRVEGLDGERVRLIGVQSGYIHAIVKLKRAIGSETAYRPINPRHTRKLKAREERLRIPREVLHQLERELESIRAALLRAKEADHGDA